MAGCEGGVASGWSNVAKIRAEVPQRKNEKISFLHAFAWFWLRVWTPLSEDSLACFLSNTEALSCTASIKGGGFADAALKFEGKQR